MAGDEGRKKKKTALKAVAATAAALVIFAGVFVMIFAGRTSARYSSDEDYHYVAVHGESTHPAGTGWIRIVNSLDGYTADENGVIKDDDGHEVVAPDSNDVMTLSSSTVYYLGEDLELKNIDVQEPSSSDGKATATVLCLSGHTVMGDGDGPVITVEEGAVLSLIDCGEGIDRTYYKELKDGLFTFGNEFKEEEDHDDIEVISEGYLEGGVIFSDEMQGITPASGSGVTPEANTPEELEEPYEGAMYDEDLCGGGVLVNGTLYMYGGNIAGNEAWCGGGVCVDGGTFYMYHGIITGNLSGGYGGAVYVTNGGVFGFDAGEIRYNYAVKSGGGVYVKDDKTYAATDTTKPGVDSPNFLMTGGSIFGNRTEGCGGGVAVDGSAYFTMEAGSLKINEASANGGGVYVTGGATFTMKIYDDKITSGTISGNSAVNGGGVYVDSGTFTMSAGTVSGNSAVNGGGVYVDSGTFSMSAGTITGNTATSCGGGVYVATGATFTPTGGSIEGNSGGDGDDNKYPPE